MTAPAAWLDSRASFELAAFFVTWIAVAVLALLVLSLQVRLQRLEVAGLAAATRAGAPYAHLLGKDLRHVLDGIDADAQPQLILFLSSTCESCRHLLSELEAPSWSAPAAVVWTDRPPAPPPALPAQTVVLKDGPKISAELGIRVTPFLVVTNTAGKIVRAAPATSLRVVADAVQQ